MYSETIPRARIFERLCGLSTEEMDLECSEFFIYLLDTIRLYSEHQKIVLNSIVNNSTINRRKPHITHHFHRRTWK